MVENPNDYIKDFVLSDGPSNWKHKDLVKKLYDVDAAFSYYFFSKQQDNQLELPQSVIAIADMRVETLAGYRLSYNPNGLFCEIIHNEKHLNRPFWAICESHLHERLHQLQEWCADHGDNSYKKCTNGFHNKQFVELAEDAGLHPMLGVGSHWRPGDGQFATLMDRLCIAPPVYKDVYVKPEGRPKTSWWDGGRSKATGKSTLTLYTNPDCVRKPLACKIRAGRDDLDISCNRCGGHFSPVL